MAPSEVITLGGSAVDPGERSLVPGGQALVGAVVGAADVGAGVGAAEIGELVAQSKSHASMLQKLAGQPSAMSRHAWVSIPSAMLSW